MKQEIKQQIGQSVQDFRLPRYQEIPDVGLYLEQATKYICRYLSPILETLLTASMISNYVKRGLLSSPVKKQYDREHLAWLLIIAVAKTVLSLEEVQQLLEQQKAQPVQQVYDSFCHMLPETLTAVFAREQSCSLLQDTVTAVAHRLYLETRFQREREA